MEDVKRIWRSNAFWHDIERKHKAQAILKIIDENGRTINQELTVNKVDADGNENPDFVELLSQVSEKRITQNTIERHKRKEAEKKVKEEKEKAQIQAKQLERLFDAKIKTLEIEQIKSSQNKELKSKLRRAKNIIEMQVYAQLIVMEELGYEIKKRD